MKKLSVILILAALLFSCATSSGSVGREESKNSDSYCISFVISNRYYAMLVEEDDSFLLTVPELLIVDLKMNRYVNKNGQILLVNTKKNINIKLYKDYLFYSQGRYYAYLSYSEILKEARDYYHIS